MNWDNLAPFLFFVLWMGISILKASKKKQSKRQPSDDIPIDKRSDNTADLPAQSQPGRTLDYMMDKPNMPEMSTQDLAAPNVNQPAPEPKPQMTPAVEQIARQMEEYLASQRLADKVKQTKEPQQKNLDSNLDLDFIQRGEISSARAAMRISIEKKQIMQAVTYAQVLEQPKSLHYLKRFGIRRILHKD